MMSRRSLRTAAFMFAAGFAVVACGGSDTAEDGAAPAPDATEQAADPTTVETAAGDDGATTTASADTPDILRFTSPLVGGGELDAAELSGKPTAFWFWSPT
jgi:hypothetical protein